MHACAYVIGPPDGSGAAVSDLARRLDFKAVLPYAGVAQAERQAQATPVCFFLFAEVEDVGVLARVAEAVRFSSGGRIRFSPLVYFCRSPSLDTIKRCIQMGFDDIITAPHAPRRVAARLQRQIGTELVYFETASYFGPDRRGRINEERRPRDENYRGQYRRIEITRTYATGVTVLHDDLQVVL